MHNVPANTLAVLQAADCATTASIIRKGGFERDPIARGIGASRSLPLCLLEAGAINIGFRFLDKNPHHTATKIAGAIELIAVGNNARVLLTWRL